MSGSDAATMLGRFRSAVTTALDGLATITGQQPDGVNGNYPPSPDLSLKPKFTYGRPHFLKLSPDEVQASSDHSLRPILIPRNSTRIAWNAGYAEVVNAGKSKHNEDQAACHAFDIYVDVPSSSNISNDASAPSTTHSNATSSFHPLNGVLNSHPSAAEEEKSNAAAESINSIDSPSSTAASTNITTPFGPTAAPNATGSRRSPPETSSLTAKISSNGKSVLSFTYFALFDGHAGTGCALWAANTLHYHVKEKLGEVAHLIAQLEESADGILTSGPTFPPFGGGGGGKKKKVRFESMNHVTADALIKGALEKAFVLMDQQIGMERHMWRITGGCTVVVALFFKTRLFIANAGDSRGIVVHGNQVTLSSKDFTPESERQRIQHLATLQPHLLGEEFTALQFPSRIAQKDIGKPILYRDFSMKGWAFKTAADEDLKYPVVLGEGKRARVLATIGVTRGFGDYDLCAFDSNIHVKPFLTPAPEVFVYDLSSNANGPIDDDDVVVLATDGLWDVVSSQRVAQIIANSFIQSLGSPRQKYTMAAQEVVMQARGMQAIPVSQHQHHQQNSRINVTPRGWRMAGGQPASGDDISCFIIPLRPALAGGADPITSAVSPEQDAHPLSSLINPTIPYSSSISSFPNWTSTSVGHDPALNAKTSNVGGGGREGSDVGEGGSSSRANPELEELLEAIRKSSLPIVKGQLVEGGRGDSSVGKVITTDADLNSSSNDGASSSKPVSSHSIPDSSPDPPLVSLQPLAPSTSPATRLSSSVSSSSKLPDVLSLSTSDATKEVATSPRQQLDRQSIEAKDSNVAGKISSEVDVINVAAVDSMEEASPRVAEKVDTLSLVGTVENPLPAATNVSSDAILDVIMEIETSSAESVPREVIATEDAESARIEGLLSTCDPDSVKKGPIDGGVPFGKESPRQKMAPNSNIPNGEEVVAIGGSLTAPTISP